MVNALKLLVPAIIPSWRFFDIIAPSPRIEFMGSDDGKNWPEQWQKFRPRPLSLSVKVLIKRIFWNPHWNETLFLVSCAERIANSGDPHAIAQIEARIRREMAAIGPASYFRFQLVFVSLQNGALVRETLFQSHPTK